MLCAFMQQSLWKKGIASLCSAEDWSDSYHTLFLPSTAAGASATMARVEPGALSMMMAFKQAQLRNLCSNLSAAQGWLFFVLKKHAPNWTVRWEGLLIELSYFIECLDRKLLVMVLFSGHPVLLVEACVFI